MAFTPYQVAAYLQDKNVHPTRYAQAASAFGVNPEDLARAVQLLGGDDGVRAASQSYRVATASNPAQDAANQQWVAGQQGRSFGGQQAELQRIRGVRNAIPESELPVWLRSAQPPGSGMPGYTAPALPASYDNTIYETNGPYGSGTFWADKMPWENWQPDTTKQEPMYPGPVPVDPPPPERMPKPLVSKPAEYPVPMRAEPERPKYYAKGGPVGALTRVRRR